MERRRLHPSGAPRSASGVAGGVLALAALACPLAAAERPSFLGYVFPAGGAPGATVAVVCAGDGLGGTSVVAVGGPPGVSARLVDGGTPPAEMKLGKKKGAAVLDEQVKLELAIAPDAAPGLRTLVLLTPRGITNLRRFQVAPLPALREAEPNDRPAQHQAVTLPCCVDGQLQAGGDADGFRFRLRAGERLTARVDARRLVPYIADAVPGWCQAVLTLSDDAGRELLTVDDSGGEPDPHLEWTAPRDGQYRLTVRDAIWRGRADFVYRLQLGGADLPARPADPGVDLNARAGATTELAPPVVVGGVIAAPGQEDRFAFTAAAGTPIAIEAWAQRLGSAIDARLVLLGPDGAVVASSDDRVDAADGERTWHADPGLLATLPKDGRYVLRLHCVQDRSGPYRLRIGPPQPRSEVLATPAALVLAPGGSAAITLHAVRRDGDARALTVTCPPPLRLDGGVIPAGAGLVQATLFAPPGTPAGALRPQLRCGDQPVAPAEDQMQAFLWRHLVPQPELLAVVAGDPVSELTATIPPEGLVLPAGKETAITVGVRRQPGRDGPIQFALRDPPAGISLRGGKIAESADSGKITVRVNATVAAMEVNLILEATLLLDPPPVPAPAASAGEATGAAAKPPPRQRQHLLLPAVPVRITAAKAKP